MTEQQLAEIEARANAATPGPWVTHKYGHEADTVRQAEWQPCGEPDHEDCAVTQAVHDISVSLNSHSDGRATKNAEFVAHAREDVPALLAEVRRLRRPAWASEAEFRRQQERRREWVRSGKDPGP